MTTEPEWLQAETRLRVRYAETDQMGVVYYANYYVWMEIGRTELVRTCGLDYATMEKEAGLFLAVIEAQCRYLAPARYDQEIVVRTGIVAANPRVVEFGYEIVLVDGGRLLAKGMTRHMWLNHQWRPTNLPERYRAALGVRP